jgi:hypothetical protein
MFADFLKQEADIYQLAPMTDGFGGTYQGWTLFWSSPCLVQPAQGGVDRDYQKDGSASTHMILLPGPWDLSAANQLRVDGKVYNVVACRNWNSLGASNANGHTTVSCVVETS